MICRKCRNDVNREAKFCKFCGNKLEHINNKTQMLDIEGVSTEKTYRESKQESNSSMIKINVLLAIILALLLIILLILATFIIKSSNAKYDKVRQSTFIQGENVVNDIPAMRNPVSFTFNEYYIDLNRYIVESKYSIDINLDSIEDEVLLIHQGKSKEIYSNPLLCIKDGKKHEILTTIPISQYNPKIDKIMDLTGDGVPDINIIYSSNEGNKEDQVLYSYKDGRYTAEDVLTNDYENREANSKNEQKLEGSVWKGTYTAGEYDRSVTISFINDSEAQFEFGPTEDTTHVPYGKYIMNIEEYDKHTGEIFLEGYKWIDKPTTMEWDLAKFIGNIDENSFGGKVVNVSYNHEIGEFYLSKIK